MAVRYKFVRKKDDSRIKTLWALLIENPDDLNNKQIEDLLSAEEELSAELHRRFGWFPSLWRRILEFRTQKKKQF